MPPKRKHGDGQTSKNRDVKKVEDDFEELDELDSDEDVPVKPNKRSKKGKAKDDSGSEKVQNKKTKVAKPTTAVKNTTSTEYTDIDFSNDKKNALGQSSNFKISSWNIDGIRAWIKKGGLEYIDKEKPDIFCVQETKCSESKLPNEAKNVPGYKIFWNSGTKDDGQSGVGLYSKEEPISVSYNLDVKEHDDEGRMITAEYDKFFLVNVYVPNSGRGLVNLQKRLRWNEIFHKYVSDLDKKKPVIVCGDMNVAHLEIDLSNPKTNRRNAGFTKEERDGLTDFLSDGYIDTFRKFYPDVTNVYTFWTYMFNCRSKNVGWRLDYFIISERLMDSICDNVVRSKVFGSDHCPITLLLSI